MDAAGTVAAVDAPPDMKLTQNTIGGNDVRGTASFFQLFSTEVGEDPLRSHGTVASLGLIPGTGPHQLFAVEEEGGDVALPMTCARDTTMLRQWIVIFRRCPDLMGFGARLY